MKRLLLLTGHFPEQKRRSSLLWVSDHLQTQGWHVAHVTLGYSWMSRVRGDARLRALPKAPAPGVRRLSRTLTHAYLQAPVHPVRLGLPLVERALARRFVRSVAPAVAAQAMSADLVICESGLPVLLAPTLAKYAHSVPRIYRVNDDISLLNAPPVVCRAESAAAQTFTRISTASPFLAQRFAGHPNITLDPMGMPQAALEDVGANPFRRSKATKIAVCAGTTQLDVAAIERIATRRPDWQVHVYGRLKTRVPQHANVTWHGEVSFAETLTAVAHADVGLAPYLDRPGVEYQSSNSNRMLLYRHFGLPILGPGRLCHPSLSSVIDQTAPDAFDRCDAFVRAPEPIADWSELACRLVQNGVTEPPSDTSTPPDTILKLRVKTVPALASSA